MPFHAGLAGEIAETRAETYDVAKREFSRVAAAVEAVSSRADGYIEAATASKLRARVARAQSSAISLAAAP